MKKLLRTVALALIAGALFSTQTLAQTTPKGALRLGLGVEGADPTGSARIGANFILGANARLQYGLDSNFALTLTAGADHFFTKINPVTGGRYQGYGVLPLKAGIKWFFVPGIYFGGEAGIAEEVSNTKFGPTRLDLSPGLGIANAHWDLSARYENFSSTGTNYGFVAIRLAYGFGL